MTKRIYAISFLLLALCVQLFAQRITRQEYIDRYKDAAIEAMRTHGIPASITLAQGCLESGDGNSDLATKANNHFGIKCHKDWNGPTFYKQDDEVGKSCFRKYKNAEQSFKDHSDFLRYRDRYAFLFDLDITDYKAWCHGLKKAGYATAPDYAQKLIKIIEDYQLYRFDREVSNKAAGKKNYLPPSPTKLQEIMVLKPTKASALYRHSFNRTIYLRNNVPYILASNLDTYESIAREYGLFTKELLRFNDLKDGDKPVAGQVVYLQAKKNKAPRHLEIHIVIEGDTYYDIAQKYGVKLKKLLKYNHATAETVIYPGDEIYLRRNKEY